MSNYKARVAKIDRTLPILGADRIHIAFVLGEACVVGKNCKEGMVGLVFPTGTQLSEDFCHHNNLNRNSELNADKNKKGFFGKNRKVRCQPFLKVRSEAYFCSTDSLQYLNKKFDLPVGSEFDTFAGAEICRKFYPKESGPGNQENARRKKSVPEFLEHEETAHFLRNLHKIEKGNLISIQAKGHGTSGRSGIHRVESPELLPLWKRLINKVRPTFKAPTPYKHVVGSRRVVLGDQDGFYGCNTFRHEVAAQIRPFLTKGMTVYYEITGYVGEKTIMPHHNLKALKDKKFTKKYGNDINYTYGAAPGTQDFYIYRITFTTPAGEVLDFSQAQLVSWCRERNLESSLDVVEPFVYDGDQDGLVELAKDLTERPDVLTEDYRDPTTISEGVVVRVDNGHLNPLFLKYKSFAFRVCESHSTAPDMEEES